MICSPTPTPDWELMKTNFDTEYTEMNKEENPHILSYIVKSHLTQNYSNHLKIYTDGSALENEQAGAEFVIPEFKTKKNKVSTVEREDLYLLQN